MNLPDPEALLASLAQIRDAAQQRVYISNSGVTPTLSLIENLSAKIRDLAWRDPHLAESLAETNLYLASIVNSPVAFAFANRSRAQVLHTMRRCSEAEPLFERAVALFGQAGLEAESGRTMVTQMENLSYLGRYEEALQLEGPARAALERNQDARYLTLIDVSLGNLYYRLNRFTESLAHYDAARARKPDAVTAASIGMGRAHVLTDMNRFDEALEAFESTRDHCRRHGLTVWVDIAEHGISRMHMRRGNYSTALQLLDQLRRKHEAENDLRRVGKCDIDRAEIYLQLNLFEEASTAAGGAIETFRKVGNRYESALGLTYRGIAEFRLMNDSEAESSFEGARQAFVEEGNATWVAVVDLWRAQLLIRQQRFAAAAELARSSALTFESQQVPVRAAHARVLWAQSLQALGQPGAALEEAVKAVAELEGYRAPWVSYQALSALGALTELQGGPDEAERLYLRAIADLESLRGNIRLDELRMSFGKDKYQVYENIVNLKLKRNDNDSAFAFVERSKSRTLLDLLERSVETVWDAGDTSSPRSARIQKLREELNLLYSRVSEAGTAVRVSALDSQTRDEITRRERELMDLLREAGSEKPAWARLQEMPTAGVADAQRMLERGETLIEFYSIGDSFQAFVVANESLQVVRDLCSVSSVRSSLKGLNFQLSKFHLGPEYLERHGGALLASTRLHLNNLFEQLIAPIAHMIEGRTRLAIVPHRMLHYVPFHALWDGRNYLIDKFEINYGASASVLDICRKRKPGSSSGRELILGAPDDSTPYINDEVAALHELMPEARVFVGAEAGPGKLREHAPSASKIHIAAHGVFRGDNPRFSALRFGNEWLNLYDIFNMRVGAEITTLSACETGISGVLDGEELLGLAQGFLYAGAPSLVVSLWMVHDRSTAQLMKRFYQGLHDGLTRSAALRQAMLAVKADSPHPYYWAPFLLLGKP